MLSFHERKAARLRKHFEDNYRHREKEESIMSHWTHILGVIRFDSFAKNVFPEPYNKQEILKTEIQMISDIIQGTNYPSGSEGPIQVNFIETNRGPTVLITGDLRDFGDADLCEVVSWVNYCREKIIQVANSRQSMLFMRDAFINCDVECHGCRYIIELKDGKFVLSIE